MTWLDENKNEIMLYNENFFTSLAAYKLSWMHMKKRLALAVEVFF